MGESIIIKVSSEKNTAKIVSVTEEIQHILNICSGYEFPLSSIEYQKCNDKEMEIRVVVHKETSFNGLLPTIESKNDIGISGPLLLGQEYYLKSDGRKTYRKYPTINLSVLNFLTKDSIYRYIPTFPRYVSILDSSIWNYYYSYEDALKDAEHKRLNTIFNEIISNYIIGLYDLAIANEYANLSSRLTRESYISDSLGHGVDVSPFLFHEEHKIEFKTLDLLTRYKWRILLLDDHADKAMNQASCKNGNYTSCKPSKYDILEKVFKSFSKDVNICKLTINKLGEIESGLKYDESDIAICCVESVEYAKEALKKYKFDIVLLDYLLGEKSSGERDYGYHLLECIKTEHINNAPSYKYYFMFISAFTTAVHERLLKNGFKRSEENWYIAEGACPTNTPYLFFFGLLHLMEKRVRDMGLEKLSPDWIKEHIIRKIFGKEYENNEQGTRQYANLYFDKVLRLLYHYKSLLRDVHNSSDIFISEGSVIATDFIQKSPELGGFLEHLTQLVYLTAFGTVRQWPEMWEEYQFIKPMVGVQESIEKYILKLKNNNI